MAQKYAEVVVNECKVNAMWWLASILLCMHAISDSIGLIKLLQIWNISPSVISIYYLMWKEQPSDHIKFMKNIILSPNMAIKLQIH